MAGDGSDSLKTAFRGFSEPPQSLPIELREFRAQIENTETNKWSENALSSMGRL